MISVKINNVSINVNVGATLTTTLDETLDSATLELPFSSVKTPYQPKTSVEISDGTKTFYFEIVADQVSLVSHKKLYYKHTITLAQNTRDLSKHLIRNSVYSQPSIQYHTATFAHHLLLSYNGLENAVKSFPFYTENNVKKPIYTHTTFTLNNKEKINNAYIRVKTNTYRYTDTTLTESTYLQQPIYTLTLNNFISQYDTYLHSAVFEIGKVVNNVLTPIKYITAQCNNDHEIYYVLTKQDIEDIFEGSGEYYIKFSGIADYSYNNYVVKWKSIPPLPTHIPTYNFVFVAKIDFVVETYYYSLYDVLDSIRKDYALSDTITPNNHYQFSLPSSGDFYNTLKNTIAPNFTFTQSTMFEAVSEVLNYLDGIPTFDNNKLLGIEYVNDNDFETINNNRYMTDIGIEIGEDYYANSMIANYQKGRVEELQICPNNTQYAPVRPNIYGITTANNWCFDVSQPIEYVKSCIVEMREFVSSSKDILNLLNDSYMIYTYDREQPIKVGANANISLGNCFKQGLDITNSVVEKTIWTNLQQARNNIINTQYNTLYYEQGNSYIFLGEAYVGAIITEYIINRAIYKEIAYAIGSESFTTNALSIDRPPEEYKMRVEYKPMLNGRVKIEGLINKLGGEFKSNQANANTQLEKLGRNMLGVDIKMGNPALTATFNIKDLSHIIKKGTIWKDSNGDTYFANKVKTSFFRNDIITTTIEFSKDFNRLSQYIKVNEEKRFYEIDSNLMVVSEDNYIEYMYFLPSDTTTETITNTTHFNDYMFDCFESNFIYFNPSNRYIYTPSFAYITSYVNDIQAPNDNVFIPMVKYGSGNSICFELQYKHPLSAGIRRTHYINEQGVATSTLVGQATLYTDNSGFADNLDIVLKSDTYASSNSSVILDVFQKFVFPKINNTYILNNNYFQEVVKFDKLAYNKRPNEIFAFNYEIALMPLNKDITFIGKELINTNTYITGVNRLKGIDDYTTLKIYVSTDNTKKYSIFDIKGFGSVVGNGCLKDNNSTDYIRILKATNNGTLLTLSNKIYSWSICDENDNILLAFNQTKEIGDNLVFSYFRTHTFINN